MWLSNTGDVSEVENLLEHNADVNLVDDVGANPLLRAAESGMHLNFFKFRKSKKMNVT